MTYKIPEAIQELSEIDQWVAYTRSKVPIASNGSLASSTDPLTWGRLKDAKHVRRVQGLPGVGFVFSQSDPYVGIDLDDCISYKYNEKDERIKGSGELASWAKVIIERFDSYTELSPSGKGIHIWLKGDIPRPGANIKDDETGAKIEVYKHSRYFTVTGRPYRDTNQKIEDRSEALLAWWDEVDFDRKRTSSPTSSHKWEPGDNWQAADVTDWIDDALAVLDADCEYSTWIKIGMAVKAGMGDAGFTHFDRWSKTSEKYPGEGKIWDKWRKLNADRISFATLAWMAQDAGFVIPIGEYVLPDGFKDGWDDWAESHGFVADESESKGLVLEWEDIVDMYEDDSPPEPYLIEPKVLGAGDIMVLYGPPKSAKSLLCLDLFRHMAMGRPWMDLLFPQKQLRVAYMQFELKRDAMRSRVQLARLSKDDREILRGHFRTTRRFTPSLKSPAFVEEATHSLITAFKGQLDVLIIDPLANIFSGENENDNAQMSEFIRQLKALKNGIDPDVAIVIIHHSAKIPKEKRREEPFAAGRGASALRGAYDAGMYLDIEGDEENYDVMTRRLWFELRNGPKIHSKVVSFHDGMWTQVETTKDGKTKDGIKFDGVDFEHQMFAEKIIEEAEEGRIYTKMMFCEQFEGGGLGGSTKIRKVIDRMASRQLIRFFREVEGVEGIEALDGRSQGYLVVKNMQYGLKKDGDGGSYFHMHNVKPEFKKSKSSGKIVGCEGWD